MDTLKEKQFIAAALERDIDLLVLEELHVSEQFREWFITQTGDEAGNKDFIGAWHSLTAAILGESDIVMVCADANSNRHAIMIENKISEKAQHQQAWRYHERGKEGISHGWWHSYATCIIAPQKYIDAMSKNEKYDHYIPYETIKAYFVAEGSLRSQYRANMLQAAIEQSRRGYQPVVSNKNTDFWNEYYQYCHQHFPDLNMRPPEKKGKKSTWVYFHPAGKEKRMRLQHKTERGSVDLEFTGRALDIDNIKNAYKAKMDNTMNCEIATSSTVIRIKVEPVSYSLPFKEQQTQIHSSLEALRRLSSLLQN